MTEKVFGAMVERSHFTDEPAERTDGNVFAPTSTGARIDDGWREVDSYRRAGRVVLVGAGAAVATAAIAARALRRR